MATRDPRVDEYLAGLPVSHRELLEHVRGEVHRIVPHVVETISYGMPAFKLGNHFLLSFAGWKRHCSIYPLTGTFLETHAELVKGFDQTKGSVHFTPEQPLPDTVLEQLIRSRLDDLEQGRR
jgi:uncharacterized protein YdhG (YjbR/CyaY superfamily)